MARIILEIPPGTVFSEPDAINSVTFMFKTQDQAIIFFEQIKQILIESERSGRSEGGQE